MTSKQLDYDTLLEIIYGFYELAKRDVMIGYHFRVIEDFDEHIPRIADFWNLQLNGEAQNKFKNIKSDTKLINLLRQAIEATEEENGWAALGPVGSHISNKTSFDSRNYGYKNLSSLFKAIDLFEIKRGPGNSYLVRDKRKKKST